jgi:hypothetical protein
MKYTKVILVLVLLSNLGIGHSLANQPTYPAKKLLYAIHSPDSVMIHNGYIRACLEGMTYREQQTHPLFSKLTCLNDLKDFVDLEKKIFSFVQFFDPALSDNIQYSNARLKRDSALSNILKSNEAFLLIKIKRDKSGNYIFNFNYTEDDFNSTDSLLPNIGLHINGYDAILNDLIRDKAKLKIALYNVCQNANRTPNCFIRSNVIINRNTNWFAAGDTLVLSALINDEDSEYFRYEWTINPAGRKTTSDTGKSTQTLLLTDTGLYCIRLRISDGITNSVPDTLLVHVVFRPQIHEIAHSDRFTNTPLNMYYQPHLTMNEYKVVRQKSQHLFLKNFPADHPEFIFQAENNPGSVNDTIFQNQFQVSRREKYYSIVYKQNEKEAGFYRFAVTVEEHGLRSVPGTFTFRFRKAACVYFQAGLSSVHYNTGPGPKKVYTTHLGIGFFIHPKIHADYQIEFAGLNNDHPQFGQNQVIRYPGHRFTGSYVMPVRIADEIMWTIDMTMITFRYPQLTSNKEAALGFGSTMRLMYIKSFAGLYIRGAYVFLRPKSMSLIPFGAFVFTVGASLQPVKKRNPAKKV